MAGFRIRDFNEGLDAGSKINRLVALRDVEKEPLGLISVANPNDNGPQPGEAAPAQPYGWDGGAQPSDAPQPDSMGLVEAARAGPTSRAPTLQEADAMRRQRRVSALRSVGDTEGANKELMTNASLGLSDAQAGEIRARTAGDLTRNDSEALALAEKQRVAQADAKARAIIEESAAQPPPTDATGAPRALTTGERIKASMATISKLEQAGLQSQADAERKRVHDSVTQQVETDAVPRKELGNKAIAGLASGDYRAAIDFSKEYGYGSGNQLISVEPDGKGGVTATFLQNGKQVQGKLPKALFDKQISDGVMAMTSKDAAEAILKADHLKAQTRASEAQAGYYGAHAEQVRAAGDRTAAQTTRDAEVTAARRRVAAVADGEAPDPEDLAIIKAEDDANKSHRARIDTTAGSPVTALRALSVSLAKDIESRRRDDPGLPELKARLDKVQQELMKRSTGAAPPAAPASASAGGVPAGWKVTKLP